MDVQAAVCHGPNQPLTIETIQLREPGPGEVLIEIVAAGLCHSDLHQIDGSTIFYPYPVIMGHEGAGFVRKIGSGVTSVALGDHVVPTAMPECRACVNCLSDEGGMCLRFLDQDLGTPFSWNGKPIAQYAGIGSFANFTVVREIQIAKIAPGISDAAACYCGCGVITGVGAALHTAKIKPGSKVIVFGLGGIGLNVLQGARLAGARQVIGVDVNPAREEQGRKFGMTEFVNPREVNGDIVEFLLGRTKGGADYTFECVGRKELMEQAFNASKVGGGVTTIVGVAPTGTKMEIDPMALLMGRTVKGEMLGGMRTRTQIPALLEWYQDGLLKIDELIAYDLPIAQINEGFEMMKKGQSTRTVVHFGD